MSLNCSEINLILSELDLCGSFIQDIIQPGYDTLALYTYKLAGAYRFGQACACGGIVAAISMIIFLAGKKR